jgi:alpha-glucosidase
MFFLSALFAMVLLASGASPAAELKSPDGKITITFDVKADAGETGCMFWAVAYEGKPILADSRLGLVLKDGPAFDNGFQIAELTRSSHDSTWKLVYGERSEIRDHYRQLVVDLHGVRRPRRRLRLTFRAYNEGAAACYTIPEQDNPRDFVIKTEKTQFSFTDDHVAYPVYSAQGEYETTRLDKVKANCERPLTVEIDGGPAVAVAEARLVDYARMRLRPVPGRPHTLVSMLGSAVAASTPYTTPWRVLMVGDTPGQLLERNYLILNLNDPCAIEDTSWIKPGKVIREVTLTTAGGKACVDFAVERGLQYVEFDAGWYGHEYDAEADATTVSVDPERSKGPLDLHDVIEYATARDIGVLVYVNRRHLERQLDEILPLYKSWGIKGVKYGFVQVGSQKWTAWLHEAVRKAAEHELMVDVHDEYRPTGYSRTYPNLMTQEGIRGNECMPTAEHNLILPFTRSLCGAGDYTVCWYSGRVKNTLAHQLGASVVFYSPWQFLFWYDRPQQYRSEPELEFFKHVPTVWDDTRVINGKIGHYITIARRSERQWYIGSLNAVARRELDIPLTFLNPDSKYTAYIYSDGSPEGGDRTNVSVRSMEVDSNTVLKADMAANGGQAVHIVPAGEQ